jgi:hypothetical protein
VLRNFVASLFSVPPRFYFNFFFFDPSSHFLASPDLCGTVSTAVAPYTSSPPPGTANIELPLPHSHGTAVQYIDDPSQDKQFTCPDVDTCDQDTNPACLPGSANYPVGGNTVNGLTTNPFDSTNSKQIGRNLRREQRCAGPNPPYYCTVQIVPCESNVEVVAYYDGNGAVRTRLFAQNSRFTFYASRHYFLAV